VDSAAEPVREMYLKPYAWEQSDIRLQCSFCGHTMEIRKGEPLPGELETFTSRGRRYLDCPKCQNGFLKIYVRRKRGKWSFKAKTVYVQPIEWRTKSKQDR